MKTPVKYSMSLSLYYTALANDTRAKKRSLRAMSMVTKRDCRRASTKRIESERQGLTPTKNRGVTTKETENRKQKLRN
jgi:hypothetical protein